MKKQVFFWILLIELLLPDQSTKLYGQALQTPFSFVLKGEKSPYDSAVVVEIKQYRLESLKMAQQDTLINGLKVELKTVENRLDLIQKRERINLQIIREFEQQAHEDFRTKEEMYSQIQRLQKAVIKGDGFLKSPKFWGGLGFAIGTTLTAFMLK